jgi:hypothetical protein
MRRIPRALVFRDLGIEKVVIAFVRFPAALR